MLTKFVEYCNSFVTIFLSAFLSALLSIDCSTPVSTPVKRLQHSCQHSCQKNARILKFLSPMHFIHITLLPVHLNEKISHSLKKIAEDNLVSFDFGAPQPDSKRQKLLECILTGNSNCIWVRFTPKNELTSLAMKKWISFS